MPVDWGSAWLGFASAAILIGVGAWIRLKVDRVTAKDKRQAEVDNTVGMFKREIASMIVSAARMTKLYKDGKLSPTVVGLTHERMGRVTARLEGNRDRLDLIPLKAGVMLNMWIDFLWSYCQTLPDTGAFLMGEDEKERKAAERYMGTLQLRTVRVWNELTGGEPPPDI